MTIHNLPRVRNGLAFVLLAAFAVGGCSSEAPSSPASGSAANVVQSSDAAQSAEKEEGPSQESLKAYFEALGSTDPGIAGEAIEMAAPGSNAQAYAIYITAGIQSNRDAGYSNEPQTVKVIEGGFALCYEGQGEDGCSEYTNIQHEGDQIADFDAGGSPLAGRLSLGSGEAQALGSVGEATMVAAYKSIRGDVVVMFEVSSASDGMWITPIYTAPDGRQSQVSGIAGPTELNAGAFANYTFTFEGAQFGGEVRVDAIGGPDAYEEGSATFATQ